MRLDMFEQHLKKAQAKYPKAFEEPNLNFKIDENEQNPPKVPDTSSLSKLFMQSPAKESEEPLMKPQSILKNYQEKHPVNDLFPEAQESAQSAPGVFSFPVPTTAESTQLLNYIVKMPA
jgi:hypothetical protein